MDLDPYEVHDILPDALADCHTPIPDSDSAAAQTVFTELARMHADGVASEKWIVDKVDEILTQTGYSSGVISLPLGQLYGLDDEWGQGWGRPIHQLKAEVQHACAAQLAGCSPAATALSEPDETAHS